MNGRTRSLNTILGPGILMAAAAIGTSHLVQSTRAGADFGFQLLWLAVLVNIMKYPFFEFGQRYTAATGETMLHGYKRLGMGYLIVFLGICMVTMITSITALTYVTASLAVSLFGDWLGERSLLWWSLIMIALCDGVLFFGRYKALDRITKLIVGILGITTIIAAVAAFGSFEPPEEEIAVASPWTLASLPFLLALMGWMPGPIELSVWPSVWMKQREEETGFRPSMREAMLDFNTGYIATIILAAAFISLGALVMYPTGEKFSPSGPVFAGQLVNLFRVSIGTWAGPIVAITAFTCRFSTTLTCLDGYPRSNGVAAALVFNQNKERFAAIFWSFNLFTAAVAVLIVAFLVKNLKAIVDTATITAFVAAPVLGFINLRLMLSRHMPWEHRPRPWLLFLAWAGLLFLLGFSVVYVISLVRG